MQDIVFYAAANETLGIVRDRTNIRNLSAPVLVLGVAVRLRMRLFADTETTAAYPVASFSGISSWEWHMDADFDPETPDKLVADTGGISVQTVTDTVYGETLSFTEFAIPISDMNTVELTEWLGDQKKRSGLTGELIGYDSSGNAVFVLQIDDFTVRNRVAGLNEPTPNRQEYLTRSQTETLVQSAFSSVSSAKQDKLTSANAGANIAIDSNGVISNTYSLPYATVNSRGGVMLAEGAEVVAGTDAEKAVTPASLKAALTGGTPFVPQDAVSSFRGVSDLGSAGTVSLAAGGAYKLSAISGDHYVTVDSAPAGKYGDDAHLELFVGNAALIHTTDPLVLMDALVPDAVNDCVIKFRDGTARMHVEDHDYGYVVTVAGGTEGTQLAGSLYYGLTGSTSGYIVFSNALDGTPVSIEELIAQSSRTRSIVGNGIDRTVIEGPSGSVISVSSTSYRLNFSNLTLKTNLYGNTTLSNVRFANAVPRIENNLAMLVNIPSAARSEFNNCQFSDIDISGASASDKYIVFVNTNGICRLKGCVFSGNKATYIVNVRGFSTYPSYNTVVQDCLFTGNTGTACRFGYAGSSCSISGSTFGNGNGILLDGGVLTIEGSTVAWVSLNGSTVNFSGTNVLNGTVYLSGTTSKAVFSGNASLSSSITGSGKVGVNGCTITGGTIASTGSRRYFFGGATINTLDGVTITGGSGDTYGGGFYQSLSATVTLLNCVITGNTTTSNGCSAYFGNESYTQADAFDVTIKGCTCAGNTGPSSEVTFLVSRATVLLENSIFQKYVYFRGAGVLTIKNIKTPYLQVRRRGEGYDSPVVTVDGATFTSSYTPGTYDTADFRIVSGSTVDLTGNTTSGKVFAGSVVSVGDYIDGVWVVGGTATVLLNGGSTIGVSGIGRYFSPGNSSDRTDISFTQNSCEFGPLADPIITNEELTFTGACSIAFRSDMPEDAIVANPVHLSAAGHLDITGVSGSSASFQHFEIVGGTISNTGRILGATVSIPANGDTCYLTYEDAGGSTVGTTIAGTAAAQTYTVPGKLISCTSD